MKYENSVNEDGEREAIYSRRLLELDMYVNDKICGIISDVLGLDLFLSLIPISGNVKSAENVVDSQREGNYLQKGEGSKKLYER